MMDDQKILGCNFDSRAKSILAASCNSWTQEAWRSLADIKELVELRKANAEIEKERDKYKAHFDKEIERHYPKKKFPRQHKELKAGN
jgi:hypothetical protein